MARGRKRTGGMTAMTFSPMDNVEYAARDLASAAVKASPMMKQMEQHLKDEAMLGAKKVLGKLGSTRGKK